MHTAIISKWGTGQGIRLSKADLKALSLEVNDVVDIIIIDNQLTIKKHIEPKTIKEIFKNYNGTDEMGEFYWGEDVGSEVIE